ncbi:molybdopterin-dependent oxidoreductase [Candidatus Poribacteria bacterium]|nr:molybdopterin-dependent oxidoreductase [Candidatus Poribacteria bacterium]
MKLHKNNIKKIPFTCTLDCGGRCELVAWVRDGKVIRIDSPPGKPDNDHKPRLIPCLRGRGQRRLMNSRERLLKPIKRSGARGSNDFTEIDWDEALDEVAEKLRYYKEQYGSEAVLHITGYGSLGGRGFSGLSASNRFFSFWGGVTDTCGNTSSWCAGIASDWMLGDVWGSIYCPDLLNSRLIILWGMNPAENRHGVNLAYFISRARDKGAKVILIDPRYTDSGILADQWIPIKPGTDVALISAIANVWENEGLTDMDFMNTYTTGYKAYRKYVLGHDDGVPKTPEWAERITKIPAETIIQLAREYISTKPAILLPGLGPQRTMYGEQTERAYITLACMSGNMGLRGGGFAHDGIEPRGRVGLGNLPYGNYRPTRRIRSENWGKFLLDGSLDPSVRMAYVVASNAINRSSDTLSNAKALEAMEFVVVQDQYFTPTAKYADIVFPICNDLERSDLVSGGGNVFYNKKAVDPLGETKTDYWVFSRLAEQLGFGYEYTHNRTQEEWVEFFLNAEKLDDDRLKQEGVIRGEIIPEMTLAGFLKDPVSNSLRTKSGLIQITCPQAEENGLPEIPVYIENKPEFPDDYPLHMVTPHSKLRANSSGHANLWLQNIEPHRIWINPADAEQRGIEDNELLEVYNQFGKMLIPARITKRIMPGVVCIYQGTWFNIDESGVDVGGCANVLTGHHSTPTGGMAVHSEWVQVRRMAE